MSPENRDISEDLNPTWGFEESMGWDQCDQQYVEKGDQEKQEQKAQSD